MRGLAKNEVLKNKIKFGNAENQWPYSEWDTKRPLCCCFHMEGLHGLWDHWTGVDLSINTNQKRLVEQNVCMFCKRIREMMDDSVFWSVLTRQAASLVSLWWYHLLESYLGKAAHILEDFSKQSAPRRSSHFPYSTWTSAGSLSPVCIISRKKTISMKKTNDPNRKNKSSQWSFSSEFG